MNKHSSNWLCFLFLFVLSNSGLSEIGTSKAFEQVVERLIKENIKQTVLSSFDPMAGIIAADLIEQSINGTDKSEIVKSAIDVGFTMTYLYAISREIDSLVNRYPEVLTQAKNMGFDKEELISYSCLYFYYSEKIKYKYIISPEINRLSKQKLFIKTLKTKSGEEWVTLISKTLIKKRRDQGRYIYDVRLNEFIRFGTKECLFSPDSAKVRLTQAWVGTVKKFKGEGSKIQTMIGKVDSSTDIYAITNKVFDLYQKAYKNSLVDTSNFDSNILESIKCILDQQYYKKEELTEYIFQTVTLRLEDLLNQASKKKKGFHYIVSLAGTIYQNPTSSDSLRMDFTILDQIRYQIQTKTGIYFVYFGGFIDPILKNTIYKEGIKLYQVGLGWQNGDIFLSLNAGLPYPEFNPKDITAGISVGYEIPLSQLIKK